MTASSASNSAATRQPSNGPFRFVCPGCRAPLRAHGEDQWICPNDQEVFRRTAGIWCFLPQDRQKYFARFVREYETVRRLEGRGSRDPRFYRALPYKDLNGQFVADWKVRATSFRCLLRKVLPAIQTEDRRPLKIIDLGAGNGWLSYRLAEAGHQLAAVDLCVNDFDGLGARVHYPITFTAIQAEVDALPFESSQFDAAIFNASLHYSTRYEDTLQEVLRVLRPKGHLIVMDTPIYRDAKSGEAMVREREANFQKQFGFPSNSLPCENYLTTARLDELARTLGIRWRTFRPFYGLRWLLKPLVARLLGRREPARFMILVAQRS
jgi:SAM-dependent methyltransferase